MATNWCYPTVARWRVLPFRSYTRHTMNKSIICPNHIPMSIYFCFANILMFKKDTLILTSMINKPFKRVLFLIISVTDTLNIFFYNLHYNHAPPKPKPYQIGKNSNSAVFQESVTPHTRPLALLRHCLIPIRSNMV